MTVVREAGPVDLDRLLPLFQGYLGFYGVAPNDARGYLAGHLEAGTATVLVAEGTGRPAPEVDELDGFALLYPTWDSLTLGRRWILYDLFVAPESRRRGVGRTLLEACLELGRSTGATSVSLDTAHDNHPAQALYEGAGFVREEEFVTYYYEL